MPHHSRDDVTGGLRGPSTRVTSTRVTSSYTHARHGRVDNHSQGMEEDAAQDNSTHAEAHVQKTPADKRPQVSQSPGERDDSVTRHAKKQLRRWHHPTRGDMTLCLHACLQVVHTSPATATARSRKLSPGGWKGLPVIWHHTLHHCSHHVRIECPPP